MKIPKFQKNIKTKKNKNFGWVVINDVRDYCTQCCSKTLINTFGQNYILNKNINFLWFGTEYVLFFKFGAQFLKHH
jgi:hypothetical protein